MKIGYDDWKKREVTPGSPPDHPAAAVLETWAESDWQAAGKWLGKVPTGPLRSEMVRDYAVRIAALEPAKAVAFLAEIPEERVRRDLIKRIAENLDGGNPEAAAAFRAEFPATGGDR